MIQTKNSIGYWAFGLASTIHIKLVISNLNTFKNFKPFSNDYVRRLVNIPENTEQTNIKYECHIVRLMQKPPLAKKLLKKNLFKWLDINFLCRMNSEAAIAHLRQHDKIRLLVETINIPDFTPSGRVYYDLLESIVSQQLSVKIATIIFNRFCALFPDNYPHPPLLAAIETERLRSAGLSNQKASYLQNVAAFSLQHDLENHQWNSMSDDEIIDFLTRIKGVGKWTAQMILMFTIGRPDIFPVDDLGIQQAMARLYGLDEKGKKFKHQMIEIAEPWRPYRTIASRYLWRWKDSTPSI